MIAELNERERRIVGSVIFHGRPGDDGIAEVGYGVELESQGRGFATEATRVCVVWALEQPECVAVTATTYPVAPRVAARDREDRHDARRHARARPLRRAPRLRAASLMACLLRRLARDFRREIREDNIGQGAAALAFYWMLALFPAAIFLLTLLAYLPIPHLERALLHFARSALPDDAGALLSSFVDTCCGTSAAACSRSAPCSPSGRRRAASTRSCTSSTWPGTSTSGARSGSAAPWRSLIAMCFVLLVIAAFGLVVFGRVLHLRLLRWIVVCAALLVGIALIYHYGPNVKRRFRLVTPGSLLALAMLIVASVGFQLFVTRVGRFNITYGSLGAAITLMLWLYLAAWAILLGAELDATLSAYARPTAR